MEFTMNVLSDKCNFSYFLKYCLQNELTITTKIRINTSKNYTKFTAHATGINWAGN